MLLIIVKFSLGSKVLVTPVFQILNLILVCKWR